MPDLLPTLQTILGIGLVIFVHELGHFLAARWCGVRVLTFSLGFGPALVSWRRGGTQYQIAAVPLGGFVQMAGEGQPPADRSELPADHLQAKSVGQRFLIYSGGVLMNLAFGLVVFPLVFLNGVRFLEPRLGSPVPGGPAWAAELPAGATVLEANGERVIEFSQIELSAALGGGRPVDLLWRPPEGGEPRLSRLEPVKNLSAGFFSLGVRPGLDPTGKLFVFPGSPAEAAGLRTGERLLELVSIGERAPLARPLDQQLRSALDSREPIELLVGGEGGEPRRVRIEPRFESAGPRRILGVGGTQHTIGALRDLALIRRLDLRVGDRILAVDGRPVHVAQDFALALEQGATAGPLELRVEREGSPLELGVPEASAQERRELSLAVSLEQDPSQARVVPTPGGAGALAGLLAGDRIVALDGKRVESWADLQAQVEARAERGGPLAVEVERPGAAEPLRFAIEPAPLPPQPFYGFAVAEAEYTFEASGVLDSLAVGLNSTWKALRDVWLTLKGMLLADVSSKNLGSIIMIGQVSYSFSEQGWANLFYFLCLLSMNLALINVLPVPLLDGGHLLFLLLEKLRGRPLPERIVGYGQMVGLVLLVGLMVYATYNDILRLLQ
jgi:regulator of sigma E protease